MNDFINKGMFEKKPDKNEGLNAEDYRDKLIGLAIKKGLSPKEAEEMTQRAYLRFYEHLEKHPGKDIEKPLSYLGRILSGVISEEFSRDKVRKNTLPQDIGDIDNIFSIGSEDGYSLEEDDPDLDLRKMHELLNDLKREDREILEGHYLKGKSYEQIAEEMGKTESAVKTRAYYLRKELNKKLRRYR